MTMTKEISVVPNVGGTSQKVVLVAATPNNSSTFAADCYALVTVDSLTFMRKGLGTATVTSAVDVDQILLANNSYRVGPILNGEKLGFISTAGGNVYITPQG